MITRSVSIGSLEIDGPSAPTSAASASSAAPTPTSAERHPRVTPTARTMVSASTISTVLARKALRKRKTSGLTIALSAAFANRPSRVVYRGVVDRAWTTMRRQRPSDDQSASGGEPPAVAQRPQPVQRLALELAAALLADAEA